MLLYMCKSYVLYLATCKRTNLAICALVNQNMSTHDIIFIRYTLICVIIVAIFLILNPKCCSNPVGPFGFRRTSIPLDFYFNNLLKQIFKYMDIVYR